MKLNFKLYKWAMKGSQRITTLSVMEGTQRPIDIMRFAKQLNKKIALNSTSDTLRSFVKKKIARCLNEEDKIGRLYVLTRQGKLIKKELTKNKLIK